jgi:hypothetical protein
MLCRDYRRKEADRLVTRIDPGVVSLVADLRAHERQAAQELDQWKTHHEERQVIDGSPAAITLAKIRNREQLEGDGSGRHWNWRRRWSPPR